MIGNFRLNCTSYEHCDFPCLANLKAIGSLKLKKHTFVLISMYSYGNVLFKNHKHLKRSKQVFPLTVDYEVLTLNYVVHYAFLLLNKVND